MAEPLTDDLDYVDRLLEAMVRRHDERRSRRGVDWLKNEYISGDLSLDEFERLVDLSLRIRHDQ